MDVINNLFVDNSMGVFTHNQSTNAEIYNNIFYNNSIGMDLDVQDYTTDFNLYWDNNTDCNCNIGSQSVISDPMFDPNSSFDVMPTSNSPVIDAGMPNIADYNIPNFDFNGNSRVMNNRIDIGPFEFDMSTSIANLDKVDIQVYPNPTNGLITIDSREVNSVVVSSLQGKIIMTTFDHSLDLSGLDNGAYLLQIFDANNALIEVKKVLKE